MAKTNRCMMIIVAIVLIASFAVLLTSCKDNNKELVRESSESEGTDTLVTLLWVIGVGLALAILFVLPFHQSSYGELAAGAMIAILLLFYYTQPITSWLFDLEPGSTGSKLLRDVLETPFEALLTAQDSVLDHLPQKVISIGDITLLQLSTKESFDTTLIPLSILVVGVAIRLAVVRYVRNERLREVTGEYWVYVLAYLVLAYVISAITNWSFLAVVGLFIAIFVALALGLLRIGGDILSAFVHLFLLLQTVLRIIAKSIVSAVTVVADFLKSVGRWIKGMYEDYIVAPIREAYNTVADFLRKLEDWLDEFLGRKPS